MVFHEHIQLTVAVQHSDNLCEHKRCNKIITKNAYPYVVETIFLKFWVLDIDL